MDQRIESFLADVLALAGEEPDAIREGVRVALADCEAIFRLQEPKKRMRAKRLTPAAHCAALAWPRSCSAAGERASWRSASSTGSRSVEGARSEPVIIALGEKVFGALLVITGAAIILTGHWTTTDDMIADLIAGGLMLASGVLVLLMWSFQR
jgi:predicted phage tail protein